MLAHGAHVLSRCAMLRRVSSERRPNVDSVNSPHNNFFTFTCRFFFPNLCLARIWTLKIARVPRRNSITRVHAHVSLARFGVFIRSRSATVWHAPVGPVLANRYRMVMYTPLGNDKFCVTSSGSVLCQSDDIEHVLLLRSKSWIKRFFRKILKIAQKDYITALHSLTSDETKILNIPNRESYNFRVPNNLSEFLARITRSNGTV